MWNLFKKKPQRPQTTADAIKRFGELLERYPIPSVLLDISMLPLPKERMKLAIKDAWLQTSHEKMRGMLEAGYGLLSCFQPGIGETPFKNPLLEDIPKDFRSNPKERDAYFQKMKPHMEKWQAQEKASSAEHEQLAAEFVNWKKSQ
jgi:hypothetical protein